MRALPAAPVALLLVLAGCGADPDPGERAAPTETSATDLGGLPMEEGGVTLASGDSVRYRCVGRGDPGMLLEAGTDSAGLAFAPSFVDPLGMHNRVCTYDRLGTGASDPAPDHERTINDLCHVQNEVRASIGLSDPTVLVGQSGGANLVIWCASRRPEAVASLVSIEGYHDDPAEMAAEFGDSSWQDNPERMDWVDASQKLDSMSMPIGTFPVLVISATDADPGGVDNQKHWLALSDESRQVVLPGGHNLHVEVPDRVAAAILEELPDD